ncbi:MAG TPA: helix-turn-helix transcriptional regulator [Solirubrobacterales bacterium]
MSAVAKVGQPKGDVRTLAGRIRIARERKGLSTKELGAAVGVGDRAVRWWEAGKTAPTLSRLREISRVLVVSVGWLLEGPAVIRDEDGGASTPQVGAAANDSPSEPQQESAARQAGV